MAAGDLDERYMVHASARYTANTGCALTGSVARENIVRSCLGAEAGSEAGGKNVRISGGSREDSSVTHHALSNLRKTFSRLPYPRFAMADCIRGGRGGAKSIVDRCRQPSGTVRTTA